MEEAGVVHEARDDVEVGVRDFLSGDAAVVEEEVESAGLGGAEDGGAMRAAACIMAAR